MKKVLSIVAIVVLVIALAITSTVAIYSSTVDVAGANTITSKKFYIGAKKGEKAFVDAAIAPGETIDWDFEVSNQKNDSYVAAVDMDMMVTIDVTTDITNLKVSLVEVTGTTENVVKTLTSTSLVDNIYRPAQPAFKANVAKTYKFIIRIEWQAGDANAEDTANGENEDTATIKVTVNGAQHV